MASEPDALGVQVEQDWLSFNTINESTILLTTEGQCGPRSNWTPLLKGSPNIYTTDGTSTIPTVRF